jgi:hypothetical protein
MFLDTTRLFVEELYIDLSHTNGFDRWNSGWALQCPLIS